MFLLESEPWVNTMKLEGFGDLLKTQDVRGSSHNVQMMCNRTSIVDR